MDKNQANHAADHKNKSSMDQSEYTYTPLKSQRGKKTGARTAEAQEAQNAKVQPLPAPGAETIQAIQEFHQLLQEKGSFSDLSPQEARRISEIFGVEADTLSILQEKGIPLGDSVRYAQLGDAFGFTVDELLDKNLTQQDGASLFKEMMAYRHFLHERWKGTEVDQIFRQYLLDKATLSQVKSAFAICQSLSIPMEVLLTDQVSATVYPEGMTETAKENYRLFAADLGVCEQALVDHAARNNESFQRMEALINDSRFFELQLQDPEECQRIYNEYEKRVKAQIQERQAQREEKQAGALEETKAKLAEMSCGGSELMGLEEAIATASADSPQQKKQVAIIVEGRAQKPASARSQDQLMGVGASTMPLLTTSGSSDFYLFDPYVNGLSEYQKKDRHSVNLSTGSFSQSFVDAVIPGKNGFDLVIGHQFFSDQSYLYRETGHIGYGSGVTRYGLSYGFYISCDYGRVHAFDVTYPTIYFDTWWEASNYLNDMYVEINWDFGFSLGGEFWWDITPIDFASGYTVFNFTEASTPNTHFTGLYGLGIGWKFMFSSVEEYGNGSVYQYLHLADGTVHAIDWGNYVSHLRDHFTKDLYFHISTEYSNGVGNSQYRLVYKDGKREYFNNLGQLIGIVDRFDNKINLVHTTQDGLPKIVITDTFGNEITIYGELTQSGHMMKVTLPQGHGELRYNVVRMNSLNYWYLNEFFDQEGNKTSHSYTGAYDTTVDIYDNKVSAMNKYVRLEDTQYPNNTTDNFAYSLATHKSSEFNGGYRQTYRLSKITTHVPTPDSLGDMSHETRYAYSDPHCMPGYQTTSYVYSTTATEVSSRPANGAVVESVSTVTKHTYGLGGLLRKIEIKTSSGLLAQVQDIWYSYHFLPNRIEKRCYGNDGVAFRTEVSMTDYDSKGNIVAAWSPLAFGDRNDNAYKTEYTYDTDHYNLLTSKTYKQDHSTTIKEIYTPDDGNARKTILRKEIIINDGMNDILKAKAEYGYDVYGRVTGVKGYKDDFIDFVLTEYSYYDEQENRDGANPAKATMRNIKNADGSPALGTSGDPDGVITTRTSYDRMGLPISQTDANGLTTAMQRNERGDVTAVTNPDSTTRQYGRDYTQNTLLFTDERGAQFLYRSMAGAQGGRSGHNGESMEDVLSGETLWHKRYDEQGRLEEEGDRYSKTKYVYDDMSRLVQKRTTDNANAVVAQESYEYDEACTDRIRRIKKTVLGEIGSPSIVTTEYVDINGRTVQAGHFLGSAELLDIFTYDYVGNLVTERRAYAADKNLAYTGKWEYDYAGRVTMTYNADGGSATNAYNPLGLMASVADYAGTATEYAYDDAGRLLEEKGVIEADGGDTYYTMKRHTYDPAGNIKKVEWTNNPVGSAYAWGKTEYDYDNRHRLEYVTAYDGAAVDSVTKYTYDGAGNVRFMETGKSGKGAADGKTTEYTYDRFGNQLALVDPLNQTESRKYDTSSLMTDRTDRNGNVFAYAYDGLKRVKTVTVTQNSAVAEVIAYDYYLTGGKKREWSTAGDWLAYTYDSLGRLDTASESGRITKSYTYDKADNRRTLLTWVGNTPILNMTYGYDNQNRLQGVWQDGLAVGTFGYDRNGNRDSVSYANGMTAAYAYNKANWLTGLVNKNGSGATLSSFAYSYYADGNQHKTTKTGAMGSTGSETTYTYDGEGRLKSESENTGLRLAYTYDRAGNRATMTASGSEAYSTVYHYDGNNRLESEEKTADETIETIVYGYDANGNQTRRVRDVYAPAGQGLGRVTFGSGYVSLYEYDAFNRMTVAFANGQTVRYDYRVDGLRKSKRAGNEVVSHVWDRTDLVADMGGSTGTVSYVRGGSLLRANTSTGVAYFLYNGHGDVTGLADSMGAATWRYDYDAFGNEREIAGQDASTDTNPFRYASQYFDVETGTYAMGARHYVPGLGRWTQEDPTHDGLNWYTYCGGNPIRYIDTSGFKRIDSSFYYAIPVTGDLRPFNGSIDYSHPGDYTSADMTKVEFTNLDLTVYTMDGVSFHTDPGLLMRGESLWLSDHSNLMKLTAGPGVAGSLANVQKMDKQQGRNDFWGITGASANVLIDLGTILVPILKPASIASKTMTVIKIGNSAVNVAVDLSNNNWQGAVTTLVTEGVGLSGSKLMNALMDAGGLVLDVNGLVKAFNNLGYEVKFYD